MKTFLFWFASLTWGCIMSTFGLFAAVGMLITAHAPKRFGHAIYFEKRRSGGGCVNLGPVFIVSKGVGHNIKAHEYGHGWQNIVYGPGHVIISLCSFTRYWYREWMRRYRPNVYLRPYDAIWFEGQATEWGLKYSPYKIN